MGTFSHAPSRYAPALHTARPQSLAGADVAGRARRAGSQPCALQRETLTRPRGAMSVVNRMI